MLHSNYNKTAFCRQD